VLIQTTSGRDGRVRLWRALFVAYGPPYLLAACLKIVQDCLAFLQPQLLRWLLAYISAYQSAQDGASYGDSPGPSPLQGFAIAVIMFVAAATQTFIMHQVCLLLMYYWGACEV
jgi:ATP-binding cassette subfamily C (CFTR/MRP) protein 1